MDDFKLPKVFWAIIIILSCSLLFFTKNSLAYTLVTNEPQLVVASNTFIFNPRSHSWKASKNGKVVKTGKASGGRQYCSDIRRSCRTPSGTYRVIGKKGAECRSSRYPVGRGGAKMPYCMFFSKHYAIHGSYDVPNYNASHGCIRVRPNDARWLHQNFINVGTTIVVQPY